MKKFIKSDGNPRRRVGPPFLAKDIGEAIAIAFPYGVDDLGEATEEEVKQWHALEENDIEHTLEQFKMLNAKLSETLKENLNLKEALKDRKEVVASFREFEKSERWYAMQLQWAEGRIDGLRKDVNRIQKERNDLFANILSSAMVTDYELEMSLLRQVIRGHEKTAIELKEVCK